MSAVSLVATPDFFGPQPQGSAKSRASQTNAQSRRHAEDNLGQSLGGALELSSQQQMMQQ